MIKIGTVYEDPEGIYEVVEVVGEYATVKQVQEGSLNLGKEYIVSVSEVKYYMEHDYKNW